MYWQGWLTRQRRRVEARQEHRVYRLEAWEEEEAMAAGVMASGMAAVEADWT